MKSKFVNRFSVRVKIVASKSLCITVMDHDTGEINVHIIDIFSGKETKDLSESSSANESETSCDSDQLQELVEEQLEEGN